MNLTISASDCSTKKEGISVRVFLLLFVCFDNLKYIDPLRIWDFEAEIFNTDLEAERHTFHLGYNFC